MVSPASVGQLVRRVLGSRIETQRQALREALTASDGVVAAGLVPDQPAGPDRSHPHFSSSGRFPASPSEPPTSSSISSKSRTPHPQSIELQPKRQSSPLPFVVAALGLSAAAAAVWFVNNQQPAPLPASGAEAPSTAAASKPKDSQYTQEPGAWGVNINSIPLDENAPEGATPGKPGHAGPGRPADTSVHSSKPGKPDKEDAKADKPAKDEKADKPEEKQPAEPQEPELEPPPTEKPPPPDQRAPLNRASALTSLSKAANSAMSCKREGGPTGAGTASVTFSTEGPVSNVSLSAPFAGTPVGTCIQTVFRSAHVPAFSGSSVTLSKSFRIPE
jgi:hypothetical protein